MKPANFITLPGRGTVLGCLRIGSDIDAGLIEDGRGHLRGDEPLPNQPIETQFVALEDARSEAGVRDTEAGRIASCASCASSRTLWTCAPS